MQVGWKKRPCLVRWLGEASLFGDPSRRLADSLLLSAPPRMSAIDTTLRFASTRASKNEGATIFACKWERHSVRRLLKEASLVGTLVGRSVPVVDPPRLLADSLLLSAPPPMSDSDTTMRFASVRAL